MEKVKSKLIKTAVAGRPQPLDIHQQQFLEALAKNVQKVLSDGDQRYLYALCLQLQDVLPSYLLHLTQLYSICDDCATAES